MAARKPWRFYVYDILDKSSNVVYVGKGSGNRYRVSIRNHEGDSGSPVAYFKKESDAYQFESDRIKELNPLNNIHPGGNGSRCARAKVYRMTKVEKEIEAVGTRVYAARILVKLFQSINCLRSKVEYPSDLLDTIDSMDITKIAMVANGCR